jgi:hypothetical protein
VFGRLVKESAVKRLITTAIALIAAASTLMLGQGLDDPVGIDLSGSWAARNFTDAIGNMPGGGPRPVDYMGIPLNESGRAWSLIYNQSQISQPERICSFYTPAYIVIGPMGLRMWPESEMLTGATTAWIIGGWVDFVPITIWMDGRPHPSKYAPHEKSGFTTGRWEDDVLVTRTTHIPAGAIRRNGVPSSDQMTMTSYFSRHDDILTVTSRLDDPVYLTEPYYLTRSFALSRAPLNPAAEPCTVTDEGVDPERVPHYLPGQNPFVDELTKLYGLPQEAVLGGAETALPSFRKKIKDKYVRPPKCASFPVSTCGGPGTYPPID